MASQQQPARPWFRLASLAGRPPPQVSTTPTPEPPAPQPRPPVVVRPPFRPMAQAQPQESGTGVSSVPTSPVRRTSVPNSPVQKSSPTSTTTTTAATSPVKSQFSAPSASLPTSPIRKPDPFTASVPTSPPKPAPFTVTAAPISPPKPAPAPYSASVTTSPTKPAPYTASVVTSPPKPAPTTATFSLPNFQNMMRSNATTVTSTNRDPSPKHSQRIIAVQTPVQSPKQNPTAPPPSPLTLPPPQIRSRAEIEHRIPTEPEPKGVLVQKILEKPKSWLHGSSEPRKDYEETHRRPGIAHHQGKHDQVPKDGDQAKNKKSSYHYKKFSSDSDHEGGGMRVITIAGDNKGAFMEVIKPPMKANNSPHTLNKNANTKTESVDGTGWRSFRSSSSSSSGEEGKSKTKDKSGLSGKSKVSPQMGNAFMNSNVQGVNNSIVSNSSCSHHDPGVHLAFSRKPSGHGFHIKDNGHTHDQS